MTTRERIEAAVKALCAQCEWVDEEARAALLAEIDALLEVVEAARKLVTYAYVPRLDPR